MGQREPSSPVEQGEPCRPLRRDARRNRDALVNAGREAFARHGLQAPLEGVARDAGVAIGTLYRHFPTRLDLVQAIVVEKLHAWLAAAERAAELDDAWAGFCLYLETVCALQADDRGFNDVASMQLPVSGCLAGVQTRIHLLGVRILARAQEQGCVRDDVTPEDLAFVIWSHGRVVEATRDVAPGVWRRHLGLLLDGFRAGRAHPLDEPALTPAQLEQAMRRLGGGSGCGGGSCD
jgi:AcrR family transcriptional regulator